MSFLRSVAGLSVGDKVRRSSRATAPSRCLNHLSWFRSSGVGTLLGTSGEQTQNWLERFHISCDLGTSLDPQKEMGSVTS